MRGKAYDPPVTSWNARQRLAADILVTHQPRRSGLRLGRLWGRLRGWRCADAHCRRRWPCPEAIWARRELVGRVYASAQAPQ